MLKLKTRIHPRATRRAAARVPSEAPIRMTRAAAEYLRRATLTDANDVRDQLRTVGREAPCIGCLRETFVLAEELPGWLCPDCLEQRPGWYTPSTLTLNEVHAVDIALGAHIRGTADALMADILDAQPVLCAQCGSRFYVFAGDPGPHTCTECTEWQTGAAEQEEMDRQQAELGRVRTACRWCDGTIYVPRDEPGPHSCWQCSYKDGL